MLRALSVLVFRFREASTDIRPKPDAWGRLIEPLAQGPETTSIGWAVACTTRHLH